MGEKLHAVLSASSASRWINCPPSARLCEDIKDKGSDYAAEGTDAHSLCEYLILKELGRPAEDPRENMTYYNDEMLDHASDYAGYVLEQFEAAKQTCKDPEILIEQRVDFSRWVEDGFGTADAIIISDGTLRIIDFKYGLGVLVEAENNPQMMCYALGALNIFDALYDISNISMTIFQPRRSNVSTWEISKNELLRWADEILKPAAQLAFAGAGEFKCGDWCKFCKVKQTCRKRAEHNLELAKYDFTPPPELDNIEIAAILEKADELAEWAADIKEYALRQALSGVEYTGWKVVEGRSNRKYINDEAVASAVSNAGFDPYEKKILGITAMTSMLGKKKFAEIIEDAGLIEKPKGKPVLVPLSDKRPAMNTAKEDFND